MGVKLLFNPIRLLFTYANPRIAKGRILILGFSGYPFRSVYSNVATSHSSYIMSQRSITSFFNKTQKKSLETKGENSIKETEAAPTAHSNENTEPVVNGNSEKRTFKRERLKSSGSESEERVITHSPVKSDKKKKVKRQRIESSSSESPSPQKSPKIEVPSPIGSPIKQTPIKVEKTSTPRTYQSQKKRKGKAEISPKVKVKSETENSVKKEKTVIAEENGQTEKISPKGPSVKNEKVTKEDGGKNKGDSATKKDDEKKSEAGNIVKEVDYSPGKSSYDPVADACWSRGQPVPYLALARTLEVIEATSARLKIVEILSNYFRSVLELTPEDLLPSVYMCLNQLAPAYHSLELGIAETYLMKAIGQCTGRTLAQVKSAAQKTGDLGLVAEQARSTQRTMFAVPPLTLRKVFAALKEVAHMTGQASVNKKINKIQSIFVACRHSEARYLIRSLAGKLRIGLAEQSVLQALAQSTVPRVKNADHFKAKVDEHALIIKTTYCECPNYEKIIPVLLQHGVAALPAHCRLAPGVPLKPMLAHPTKGVHEVFNRFEGVEFTCEWKYDGERLQLHLAEGGAVSVFSRNQEDTTTKFPDVVRRVDKLLRRAGPEPPEHAVRSAVLDCEAVAYDVDEKQILPFQILSTRKRKDAAESEIKVQVCVFMFDLLYLNGRALVAEPLRTRRALLKEHFHEVEGEWQFAKSKDCSTMEEVQQFLDESVKGSCEGLMVKTLAGKDATYEIARRSRNWLKLKKDYLEGVGDTLDVVVVGGYSGRGKRAGVFGGFLLACYDPDAEEYQSVCKIGTGFTDDDLHTLSQTLAEHVIDAPRNYYRYDTSHTPDTWFSAACVWEVRCADLSLSPVHRAAIGHVDPDKGISLRFPRFVRVRDDKSPEQATSAHQVAELYLSQDQVKNQTGKPPAHDDFY